MSPWPATLTGVDMPPKHEVWIDPDNGRPKLFLREETMGDYGHGRLMVGVKSGMAVQHFVTDSKLKRWTPVRSQEDQATLDAQDETIASLERELDDADHVRRTLEDTLKVATRLLDQDKAEDVRAYYRKAISGRRIARRSDEE